MNAQNGCAFAAVASVQVRANIRTLLNSLSQRSMKKFLKEFAGNGFTAAFLSPGKDRVGPVEMYLAAFFTGVQDSIISIEATGNPFSLEENKLSFYSGRGTIRSSLIFEFHEPQWLQLFMQRYVTAYDELQIVSPVEALRVLRSLSSKMSMNFFASGGPLFKTYKKTMTAWKGGHVAFLEGAAYSCYSNGETQVSGPWSNWPRLADSPLAYMTQ